MSSNSIVVTYAKNGQSEEFTFAYDGPDSHDQLQDEVVSRTFHDAWGKYLTDDHDATLLKDFNRGSGASTAMASRRELIVRLGVDSLSYTVDGEPPRQIVA